MPLTNKIADRAGFTFHQAAAVVPHLTAPVLKRLREAAAKALASGEGSGKRLAQGIEQRAPATAEMGDSSQAQVNKRTMLVRWSAAQVV